MSIEKGTILRKKELSSAGLALLAFLGAATPADALRKLHDTVTPHSTHTVAFSEAALLESVMGKTQYFLRSNMLKRSPQYAALKKHYLTERTKGLRGLDVRQQKRHNRAQFRTDRRIFLNTLDIFFSDVHAMHAVDRSLIHNTVGVDGTARNDFLDILTYAFRVDPVKNKGTLGTLDERMRLWGSIFDAVVGYLRTSVRERMPEDVARSGLGTRERPQTQPDDNRNRD